MNGFKKGTKIALENGGKAEIISLLGGGGQGDVYKVKLNKEEYALKWYKPQYIKSLNEQNAKGWFMENLRQNISKGPPNDKFIWPLYLSKEIKDSFGYIMKLRPSGYYDFTDIYCTHDKDGNKVGFKNVRASVNSAINIVEAFKDLHRKGYTYLDLNDGNFFIDINNGDVLVCDNDNVTGDPRFNLGKPGYVAPELVRNDPGVNSSLLTDAHSLAVILFRLFMHHDPLMGRKFTISVCISPAKEFELYGGDPVFIFDPNDASNRPVVNLHVNPLKLWPQYPAYVRDAFVKTLAKGMKEPAQRLSESEWLKVLIRFRDEIITCPACGATMLLTGMPDSKTVSCWRCRADYPFPYHLKFGDYRVLLFPGNELLHCHIFDGEDYSTVLGQSVRSKKDPSRWGLMNLSNDSWRVTKPDGSADNVGKDGILVIAKGTKIEFPFDKTAVIDSK